MQVIELRDPKSLRPHTLNSRLYGPVELGDSFMASIRLHGIIVPLVIIQSGIILSGHRRHGGAVAAGLTQVPCLVRDIEDELISEQVLIESNDQRKKTRDVISREADCLMEIESLLSAKRQEASRITKVVHGDGTLPSPQKQGESSEIVGKKINLAGKTVRKAAKVGKAIRQAEERGDTEVASRLAETVRTQSFSAGERLVDELEKPQESPLPEPPSPESPKSLTRWEIAKGATKKINEIVSRLKLIISEVDSLREEAGGGRIRISEFEAHIKSAQSCLKIARPSKECPKCEGEKCVRCGGHGWLSDMQWRGLVKEE